MSADIRNGRTDIDILDSDARDTALKYSAALRTYRHALDKCRDTLARFGAGSPMYRIVEQQLNEARDRFRKMAENYIRHAQLLNEFLAGGMYE